MQHVAVAVIYNRAGKVLVGLRPADVHQGGLWEFPGGKVESGEGVRDALEREIAEEVGLQIVDARPLIRVRHAYSDKAVLLDAWRVDRYRRLAQAGERQRLEWVPARELGARRFPAANGAIIKAAQLPSVYSITPDPAAGEAGRRDFLDRVDRLLAAGVRLLQFRAKSLGPSEYRALAISALQRCRRYGARLLLNGPPELAQALQADGVHLDSRRLAQLGRRPLPAHMWVGASCHNRDEVAHANAAGVDFIVVSPVLPTPSHPAARPLGWDGLLALTEDANMPVYALGGMGQAELGQAWRHGAQGIAAIRGLWDAVDVEAVVRACAR